MADGIQPAEAIRALAEDGVIRSAAPFAPDQIQPASLDLRLGARAHRVRGAILAPRCQQDPSCTSCAATQ